MAHNRKIPIIIQPQQIDLMRVRQSFNESSLNRLKIKKDYAGGSTYYHHNKINFKHNYC